MSFSFRKLIAVTAIFCFGSVAANAQSTNAEIPNEVCKLAAVMLDRDLGDGKSITSDERKWVEAYVADGARQCDEAPAGPLLKALAILEPEDAEQRAIVEQVNSYIKTIITPDAYVPMVFGFVKGDFGKRRGDVALYWLKYANEIGIPDAIYEYGGLYRDGGLGIAKNPVRARELFLLAADKGSYKSMYWLGTEFFLQDGKKRKWKEHENWLIKASQYGSVDAAFSLANAYSGDDMTKVFGIPKNIKKGRKYSRIAAEAGNVDAMGLYASYLLRGRDNGKYENEVFYWLGRASDEGSKSAQQALARFGPRLRKLYQESRQLKASARKRIFKQCPQVQRCTVYTNQYGRTGEKYCAMQTDYWNCNKGD